MRPPTDVASIAAGIARARIPISSLMAIRRAWNVLFAGFPPLARAAAGIACRTMSTRSPVRSIGRSARRRTMARAMRGRVPLLAVVGDDSREARLVLVAHQVGGRALVIAIHPHVERGVGRVAEAALLVVHLHRRDPEVEEDRVRARASRGRQGPPRRRRTRPGGRRSARQSARADRSRRRIASASRSMPTSDARGAASSTASACPPSPNVASIGDGPLPFEGRAKQLDATVEHHRNVPRRGVAHEALLS